MIIPLSTAAIGALLGALRARAAKGKPADLAQWAAVWGIIGFLLGFVALIVVSRAAA